MSLDEYTCELQEKEEHEMYAFMCEASAKLNSYLGKKLYKIIKKEFLDKESCITLNPDIEVDEIACIEWFKKTKGTKYKNIGFSFNRSESKYIFELATNWIYFGEGERYKVNNQVGKRSDDIFCLIDEIQKLRLSNTL